MSNPGAESARIRAELKMTKGAKLCGLGSCQVITQGGAAGLRQHRQVVHAVEDDCPDMYKCPSCGQCELHENHTAWCTKGR